MAMEHAHGHSQARQEGPGIPQRIPHQRPVRSAGAPVGPGGAVELGDGPRSFRELQALCGAISPSILNSRLKDLREAGILENSPDGYRLTSRGAALRKIIVPMTQWSAVWSEEVFAFVKAGMREKVFAEPTES